MKNLAFMLLLTGVLAGIGSCRKINEATQFSIDYSTTLSVPAASIIVSNTQEFVTSETATGTADRFKSEGTSQDLIDEVVMTQFRIAADSGNLDYLRSVSIYIRGAGLSDVLVAQKNNIPAGSTFVQTDMTGANIKEHIFKETIRYRVVITFNAASTQDHNLKLDQTVLVKGKLLK
jgi:hypothetical protein